MNDLFPKVTNYFVLPDYAETKKSFSHSIPKWLAVGAVIGAIGFGVFAFSANFLNGNNIDLTDSITKCFYQYN